MHFLFLSIPNNEVIPELEDTANEPSFVESNLSCWKQFNNRNLHSLKCLVFRIEHSYYHYDTMKCDQYCQTLSVIGA